MSRRERVLAVAAMLLSAVAAALATVGVALPAAGAAGAATFIVGIDFLSRRATRPAPERTQIEKFIGQGRKLVIYARGDAGLFAHWYIELRGAEECDRARRSSRPLSYLVIEPARSHDAGAAAHELSIWLASELGQAYIAGSLRNGRYIVLMPEADADAAHAAIARLRHAGYATAAGYACFPHDGTTHDELYKSAAGQLPISLRHVA
jgi:hypothetical protein